MTPKVRRYHYLFSILSVFFFCIEAFCYESGAPASDPPVSIEANQKLSELLIAKAFPKRQDNEELTEYQARLQAFYTQIEELLKSGVNPNDVFRFSQIRSGAYYSGSRETKTPVVFALIESAVVSRVRDRVDIRPVLRLLFQYGLSLDTKANKFGAPRVNGKITDLFTGGLETIDINIISDYLSLYNHYIQHYGHQASQEILALLLEHSTTEMIAQVDSAGKFPFEYLFREAKLPQKYGIVNPSDLHILNQLCEINADASAYCTQPSLLPDGMTLISHQTHSNVSVAYNQGEAYAFFSQVISRPKIHWYDYDYHRFHQYNLTTNQMTQTWSFDKFGVDGDIEGEESLIEAPKMMSVGFINNKVVGITTMEQVADGILHPNGEDAGGVYETAFFNLTDRTIYVYGTYVSVGRYITPGVNYVEMRPGFREDGTPEYIYERPEYEEGKFVVDGTPVHFVTQAADGDSFDEEITSYFFTKIIDPTGGLVAKFGTSRLTHEGQVNNAGSMHELKGFTDNESNSATELHSVNGYSVHYTEEGLILKNSSDAEVRLPVQVKSLLDVRLVNTQQGQHTLVFTDQSEDSIHNTAVFSLDLTSYIEQF